MGFTEETYGGVNIFHLSGKIMGGPETQEIRKRLKPMNSLSSLGAAEKVVYLTIQDFNEKWADRKLQGFAEAQESSPANV